MGKLKLDLDVSNAKIAVIGLGYVGLPLAVEFGRKYQVVGYDINTRRVEQLRSGNDVTLEASEEEIMSSKGITFTADAGELKTCNCFIVTVPTPIDDYKRPDLSFVLSASELVGGVIKRGTSSFTSLLCTLGAPRRTVFLYWRKFQD